MNEDLRGWPVEEVRLPVESIVILETPVAFACIVHDPATNRLKLQPDDERTIGGTIDVRA